MTLAGFVTYDDVAETLSVDVREAIEVGAPCAGGFAHLWDWQWHDAAGWILPEKECHWRCAHCRVTTHFDPRPQAERERSLASAHLEDFFS